MYRVQIIPEQSTLGNNRGPAVGMFALQQALRKHGLPDWLSIGDGERLDYDVIPCYWLYTHGRDAVKCHEQGRPFIIGQNMLFEDSRNPKRYGHEWIICESPHCRLILTDGVGRYEKLIGENLGANSKAKVVAVPYPVRPSYYVSPLISDVLIYAKSGYTEETIESICSEFQNCRVARYGQYTRKNLIHAASDAKCCLYLSDNDRMPIAAAEILLTGCPLIGTAYGCPVVKAIPMIGMCIPDLTIATCVYAINELLELRWSRERIRVQATEFFSPARIAPLVIAALDEARQ